MRRFISFILVFLSGWVHAEEAAPAKVLGWSKMANFGANLSFSSSHNVVGQTDGDSQTYGLNLKGSLNRASESDEWRNNLSILENTTRTPSAPRFLKSGDELKVGSEYLYSFVETPNLGPYVKGEASAPVFKGEDIRQNPTNYLVKSQANPAGTTVRGTNLRLTDGFRPLNTKESVGAYWKAVNEPKVKIELHLGVAALQINAKGQYAVTGTDGTTGDVNVNELKDVSQAGLEGSLSVKGRVDEKSSYELGVETLTPFINNKSGSDDRSALRLTDVDGFAKFKSNVTSWAAFAYDYKLKMQPQLVDRVQQIHMIVLNVNYNLF